jgi:hypothetical protein
MGVNPEEGAARSLAAAVHVRQERPALAWWLFPLQAPPPTICRTSRAAAKPTSHLHQCSSALSGRMLPVQSLSSQHAESDVLSLSVQLNHILACLPTMELPAGTRLLVLNCAPSPLPYTSSRCTACSCQPNHMSHSRLSVEPPWAIHALVS